MTKNLVIIAAMMTLCSGAMAQDEGTSSGGGFFSGLSLNTNHKFQVSLLLGNQTLFDQSLTYLKPAYNNSSEAGKAIGLPSENGQSGDPFTYLQIQDLGHGNLMNMAGVQFSYFLFDGLDLNASFGIDLRSTPKKDFVEGTQISDMAVQGQKWIEGQFKNNWLLTLGGNYHFNVSNEKIDMYAGLQFGFQHGHINTYTPFTDGDYSYITNSIEKLEKAVQDAQEKYDGVKAEALNSQMALYDAQIEFYSAKSDLASKTLDFERAETKYNIALDNPDFTDEEREQLRIQRQTAYTDKTLAEATKGKKETNLGNMQTSYNSSIDKLESAQKSVDDAIEKLTKSRDASVLYTPRVGSGQILCFTTSVTAGVTYSLTDGLFLGLEFAPYTFHYMKLDVCPQGNQVYQASAFANRFFTNTLVKIGFRF